MKKQPQTFDDFTGKKLKENSSMAANGELIIAAINKTKNKAQQIIEDLINTVITYDYNENGDLTATNYTNTVIDPDYYYSEVNTYNEDGDRTGTSWTKTAIEEG